MLSKMPIFLCLMRKASVPKLESPGAKSVTCPNCGYECWSTTESRKAAKAVAAKGFEVKAW